MDFPQLVQNVLPDCMGAPQLGQKPPDWADEGDGGGGGGGGVPYCCWLYGCGEVFIEKKPIVANIQATKISMAPTNTMVKIAPSQSKYPAVSKECSPVL